MSAESVINYRYNVWDFQRITVRYKIQAGLIYEIVCSNLDWTGH